MPEFGAFWRRKIRTLVDRIDLDRDGQVTRKDFEDWCDRYDQTGRVSKAKGDQFRTVLMEFWNDFMAEIVKTRPLTADVYAEALSKRGKKDLLKVVDDFYNLLFDMMDLNDDGTISLDEFTVYYQVLGLDAKMAAVVFAAIDTNKDNVLSRAEFLAGGEDFFMNEEKSPYQLFWGPLVA